MPELSFRDDGHVYMLDGERLPCVSDLCKPLHREIYKNAPAWQMEAAAERGTAVHKAAELLDKCGSAPIDEEYRPYLLAYKAFLRDTCPSWSLIEQPLYHPDLRYAGTVDRYGQLSGESALVDVKTTYAVYKPLCRAQLNLYRLMLIARGFPVRRMYILHLRKDSTYKLIPMPVDEPLAHALITIFNALPKRRKKGAPHV